MRPTSRNNQLRGLVCIALLCAVQLFGRTGIGVQAGIWKPSSLDRDPSNPLAAIQGSGSSFGVQATTPVWQGFALQLSAWTWQRSAGADRAKTCLVHLSGDLKNLLLSQTRLQPYVIYGAALISGKEENGRFNQIGLSVNCGAGFDLQVHPRFILSLEYQYLYVILNHRHSQSPDYSGPKLTAKFAFLL